MTQIGPPMTQEPDEWSVEQCSCGRVVLRVGVIEQSFTPAEFARLCRFLQAAMRAFGISPSRRELENFFGRPH
jgi:hypothetical protein